MPPLPQELPKELKGLADNAKIHHQQGFAGALCFENNIYVTIPHNDKALVLIIENLYGKIW